MKKGISVLLVLTILLLNVQGIVYAQQKTGENEINVYVNDTEITFDVPPMFVKSFTMVPVRAVFEALGAEIGWDNFTKTVTIKRNGTEIRVQVENRVAMINNRQYIMDVPALGINGRVMVPVRFVSEVLGAKVDWVNETKTVFINDLKVQKELGNILNGGKFASDNNWYYHVLPDGVLVRENKVTKQKEKISDNIIGDLHIVDDRIYCIGKDKGINKVIRMKMDGSEKEVIINKPVISMQVVNNWIYYSETNNETALFRTKTDGTETMKITENGDFSYKNWFIQNGWIYYISTQDQTVSRIRIDGSDKRNLTGRILGKNISDRKIYNLKLIDQEFLYFVINEVITDASNVKYMPGMYRIPVTGGKPAMITDKIPLSVNMDENWLYLAVENLDKNYRLIRCRKDGSEVITINEYKTGDIPRNIYLDNSLIFYTVIRGAETPEELLFSMGSYGDNIQQYTWIYGSDYYSAKKILTDTYSVHKSLNSLNTIQTSTVYDGNAISSIIEEYTINRSRALLYKKTLTGEQSYYEIWLEGETLYSKKSSEMHWNIAKISKSDAVKIQKSVFDFIQPTDELCNNLNVEENENSFILKGKGTFPSFIGNVLPLLGLDGETAIELAELEIRINRQKKYIEELNLTVRYNSDIKENGEFRQFTNNYHFVNSQFNSVYLNIPYTVSQSVKAKENADRNIESGMEKFGQGKYEEAIKFFDTAIGLYNKSHSAYLYKGKSLYNLGKYREAILTYSQYHEVSPSDAEVFALMGMCYFKIGDFVKAEEMGRETLKYIQSADAYNLLGNIAFINEDYKTAAEYFRKSVSLDSKNHTSVLKLVSALYTMGSYTRCIEAVDNSLEHFPKDRELLYYKAQCFTSLGKHEQAIKVYQDILSNNPSNDFVTMTYIAREYETLQNYQKAKEYADKASTIYPDYSLLKFLLEKLDYDLSVSAGKKLVDFIKENYLYYSADLSSEFESILEKGNLFSAEDVINLVNSIKAANDNLTDVVTGFDYNFYLGSADTRFISTRQDDKYVYVRFINLYPGTGVRFREFIQDVENPGEKVLVIDLRDNKSGLSDEAGIILDALLGECTPGYIIDRDGYVRTYQSDKWHTAFKKIGILVNENTSGSAELLTLGLRTFADNVTIIGNKTAGKGVGQVIYIDRSNKFAVLLVNHYWNILQNNIEGKGIEPDIHIGESDLDYSKAIDRFIIESN